MIQSENKPVGIENLFGDIGKGANNFLNDIWIYILIGVVIVIILGFIYKKLKW